MDLCPGLELQLEKDFKRENATTANMVFMQWWLTCMLPAIDYQISLIPLTKTDGTGNATTSAMLRTLAATSLRMFNNFRPYDLLGIAGLLLFFISFFIPFQSVDIHFHDTYYVFEMSDAFRNMGGALLALFTVNTFLKRNVYSIALSWIHTILTTLTVAAALFFLYKASYAYQPGFSDWKTFKTNNTIISITIWTFLLAQTLLVSNLMIGTFKKSKRPAERL